MPIENNTPAIRFAGFTGAWEQKKLEEVCDEFQSGNFIPSSEISICGEYPVYGGNGLRGYARVCNHCGEYALIGRQGAQCGNVNYSIGPAYFTEHAIAVKANSYNRTRFIFYLLSLLNLGQYSAQSAQPGLAVNKIIVLRAQLPSKAEQTKIEGLIHNLDTLITLHRRKCERLETLKKSMLEKLFPKEGKLVPDLRFAGFTGEWEKRKLGDIVDVRSGKDYKHLSDGPIPVYGTGGYMLSVDKALSYQEDAVGIGRKGTIDKPYILRAPFWTVDTLFYALPQKQCDLYFLFALFQKIDWKIRDESTGVPSLSKTAINEVRVKTSSPEEQQLIGNYFKDIDTLITLHRRKLERLQNIKKACLEKMFV